MKTPTLQVRLPDVLHALFLSGANGPAAPGPLVLRTRIALREGHLNLAESLLGECGDAAEGDTDCLNLRGVIAELRGDWRMARRYWVRAARGNPPSAAAMHNLRRYFELFEFGRCRDRVALGDEPLLQLIDNERSS